MSAATDFNRLRPRRVEVPAQGSRTVDVEGKRALFSTEVPLPTLGSVTVECTSCDEVSVLTMLQASRVALTGVHLPLLRRRFSSYVKCPACGRRTWCRIRLRI